MGEYDDLSDEVNRLKQVIEKTRKKCSDTSLSNLVKSLPSLPRIQPKTRRVLGGHLAKIYALQWANDSRNLVSASQDGKLIVWDCFTGYKLHAVPLRSSWVMTCSYSPSGQMVASGGLDNTCSVVDLRGSSGRDIRARIVRELRGHTGYLSHCQFVSDSHILTASEDGTCVLWNIETGQLEQRYSGHDSDVMNISVGEGGSVFASGGCDQRVLLWDMRNSVRPVQSFHEHHADVNCVKIYPNNAAILSGSDDSSARLLDLRADQAVALYSHDQITFGITSIDVSRSGRLLFAGYDNYTVNMYDCLKQERVGLFVGHDNRVSCLGVTKDGQAICTGSWDTTLRIWN